MLFGAKTTQRVYPVAFGQKALRDSRQVRLWELTRIPGYKKGCHDGIRNHIRVAAKQPRGKLEGGRSPLHGNPQDRLCRFEGPEPAAASGG